MKYHCYCLSAPIDFGWCHLKSVKETLGSIAVGEVPLEFEKPYSLNEKDATKFLENWEEAQALATKAGWEEDFRESPRVFWLPSASQFEYAFDYKQDSKGRTYVISPLKLDWLDEISW